MKRGGENKNPEPSPNPNDPIKVIEIKSCTGCLYYPTILKTKSRNPTCVGIPRTKTYQVPSSLIKGSDLEATKVAPTLREFKYACVGYSEYVKSKGSSTDNLDKSTSLPRCAGLEVYMLRTPSADHVPTHAHSHKDGHISPQPRTYQPTQSIGDEYISRLKRNANLVASGVAKNLNRVGRHVKESLYGRSK